MDSASADQSGLGAGTYKLKVTDKNGCILDEEFTITQPDELKISYILGTDSLSCYADETTLKVIIDQQSVSPYDYKLEGTNYLNDNILIEITDTSETSYTFDVNAGTYKITVTDKKAVLFKHNGKFPGPNTKIIMTNIHLCHCQHLHQSSNHLLLIQPNQHPVWLIIVSTLMPV